MVSIPSIYIILRSLRCLRGREEVGALVVSVPTVGVPPHDGAFVAGGSVRSATGLTVGAGVGASLPLGINVI